MLYSRAVFPVCFKYGSMYMSVPPHCTIPPHTRSLQPCRHVFMQCMSVADVCLISPELRHREALPHLLQNTMLKDRARGSQNHHRSWVISVIPQCHRRHSPNSVRLVEGDHVFIPSYISLSVKKLRLLMSLGAICFQRIAPLFSVTFWVMFL